MARFKKNLTYSYTLINRIKNILYILIQFKECFMRLSRAAEYAIRCMLFLSITGKGVLVSRKAVAREMDIPEQFLGKIAQQLARAGLIEIVQGAKGGFRLTVLPADLTLLMVIEAVIGEIFLNDCVLRPASCDRSTDCKVHVVWENTRNQLRESLRKVTFPALITDTPAFALDSHSGKPDSHTP
jgi:Rrf2 family protein